MIGYIAFARDGLQQLLIMGQRNSVISAMLGRALYNSKYKLGKQRFVLIALICLHKFFCLVNKFLKYDVTFFCVCIDIKLVECRVIGDKSSSP